MKWKNDLSTGVDFIDSEHRELIDIIATMLKMVKKGEDLDEILDILDCLEDFSVNHFANEEDYMQELNYSEYRKHMESHKEFVTNILEMKKDIQIRGERVDLRGSINNMLSSWFIDHINKFDKKFGEFVNSEK